MLYIVKIYKCNAYLCLYQDVYSILSLYKDDMFVYIEQNKISDKYFFQCLKLSFSSLSFIYIHLGPFYLFPLSIIPLPIEKKTMCPSILSFNIYNCSFYNTMPACFYRKIFRNYQLPIIPSHINA